MEHTSNKFLELHALDGKMQQTLCTYTLKKNGVAERKHRYIVEIARSLLLMTSILSEFWGEAVNLINTIHSLIFQVFLISRNYTSMP